MYIIDIDNNETKVEIKQRINGSSREMHVGKYEYTLEA